MKNFHDKATQDTGARYYELGYKVSLLRNTYFLKTTFMFMSKVAEAVLENILKA